VYLSCFSGGNSGRWGWGGGPRGVGGWCTVDAGLWNADDLGPDVDGRAVPFLDNGAGVVICTDTVVGGLIGGPVGGGGAGVVISNDRLCDSAVVAREVCIGDGAANRAGFGVLTANPPPYCCSCCS
jgi:hypothetical protein